jgi:hypothetical protein
MEISKMAINAKKFKMKTFSMNNDASNKKDYSMRIILSEKAIL